MRNFKLYLIFSLVMFFVSTSFAKDITTNEAYMKNAPKWLTRPKVEKVADRIQTKLEWSTRRIHVYWYYSQAEYSKQHNFGTQSVAFAKKSSKGSSIHLGPRVNKNNFAQIFGHELVHIIIYQKYKGSIPKWLEEGLANHLSKMDKVNYKWLAKQPFPKDVTALAHPFKAMSKKKVTYNYKASQALAEMLEKKCDLQNLIRLSVERKMENYIKSYCEIKDINAEFKKWVKRKSTLGV